VAGGLALRLPASAVRRRWPEHEDGHTRPSRLYCARTLRTRGQPTAVSRWPTAMTVGLCRCRESLRRHNLQALLRPWLPAPFRAPSYEAKGISPLSEISPSLWRLVF
jgi:hypothetical protein